MDQQCKPPRHRTSEPGRMVRGHTLVRDATGPARFTDDGQQITAPRAGDLLGRAMCECGLTSAPGLGNHLVASWHRDHRRTIAGLD